MPGPPDELLTQPRENQRGTFYSQLALEPRQMASEPCPTPGTGSGTWERRSGPWGWARGPGWGRGPCPVWGLLLHSSRYMHFFPPNTKAHGSHQLCAWPSSEPRSLMTPIRRGTCSHQKHITKFLGSPVGSEASP